VISVLEILFLSTSVSFFDFVYLLIAQVHIDTSINIAMNISKIPIIPIGAIFSRTVTISLIVVHYLFQLFKKDLPNLVITKIIGNVGITNHEVL